MSVPRKRIGIVCATCKRELPASKIEKNRARCKDRDDCARAFAEWISKERFAVGVVKG